MVELSNIYRTKNSDVVDADGHILEPPDLWENYLEERYLDRALRIEKDDNGLERLSIGGKPSVMSANGFPSTLGLMGKTAKADFRPDPERTYLSNMPFGAMDADERVQMLDAEGLDAAVLYPTIGILWEAELEDIELSQAYCRAYNRWIADFCRPHGKRLVPIAHLSLGDPEAAAVELERAVKDGCRGAFVVPFTLTHKAHGHPDHDPLYAKAQELDVPIALHPSFEPTTLRSQRFDDPRRTPLLSSVTASDGVRHAFTTFFDYATFDRFPDLKLVVLESGGGWIGYWMDRLDAVYEDTIIGTGAKTQKKPSDWFKTNCYISCDPDERTIAAMMALLAEDRFFWASDYPHADHTPDYLKKLDGLAETLSGTARSGLLGANVRTAYGF
ncbi:MAG: amidohydrolase [Proteobacteria bacterium]|nr:amidohydrolase [Pseudomonadota bacterium]